MPKLVWMAAAAALALTAAAVAIIHASTDPSLIPDPGDRRRPAQARRETSALPGSASAPALARSPPRPEPALPEAPPQEPPQPSPGVYVPPELDQPRVVFQPGDEEARAQALVQTREERRNLQIEALNRRNAQRVAGSRP